MGANSQYAPTTKYMIVARFEVEGVVEKPDVIGAIFGQTEGLFGPDLDLRELQKSGRIGRIEIQLDSRQDRTFGVITIPSSLDKTSTAIIAAAVQSVDRIGPCLAKVTLDKVADIRDSMTTAPGVSSSAKAFTRAQAGGRRLRSPCTTLLSSSRPYRPSSGKTRAISGAAPNMARSTWATEPTSTSPFK